MIEHHHGLLIRKNSYILGIFPTDGKDTDFSEQTCLLVDSKYAGRVGACGSAVQIFTAGGNAQTGRCAADLLLVLTNTYLLDLFKFGLTAAVVIRIYQYFIGKLAVYISKTTVPAESDQSRP